MARFINPIPQYKPNSKLYFYKSGTNTDLLTYKDQFETVLNTQPVLTDAAGFAPNIFYSGSAKLIILDQDDVQYAERDPVGGEKELGAFNLWDTVVTYDQNDIALASDGRFYQSFADGNQGNDPISSPSDWFEIRFTPVYNANYTFALGEITQTSDGSLWRSVVGSNTGNNPATDDGTNWLPAVDSSKIQEIIKLTWKTKASDFTAIANESYQIDGSANTVDVAMPVIAEGETFTFHNQSLSTFAVTILNPSYTIIGKSGTLSAGTDLELSASDSVQLVAKTSSVLEIVGAQV